MGQIDFGKIISAAAVSTLGVLSLIIVALGVIAFFFFKGSPEKVKLSVWWTMLVAGGLFAAAVVKQSDPQERAGPDPRPTEAPAPVPTRGSGPDRQASPSFTPEPSPSETATARPADRAVGDLTGRWHDNDGYVYDVTSAGTAFSYQQRQNGVAVGSGQGTLDGRTLRYRYTVADGGGGECKAIVAGDANSMSGTCTSGAQSWPFFVER